MLGDLIEVAGQHLDRLVDFGALVPVEGSDGGSRGLFQFVEQLDRQPRKVINEVEWVFDLVGDSGSQLAERGHLLSLDEACLRRLQLAKRRLSRVARFADCLLGTLPGSDVTEDHDEPAAGYRIVMHF